VGYGYRQAASRILKAIFSHPSTVYKGMPIIGSDRIFAAGYDGSYALRR
jgi:hypothetical protein